MSTDVEVHVAISGVAIQAAMLADLIDDAVKSGSKHGEGLLVPLLPEQIRRLQFLATQVATDARALERTIEEAPGYEVAGCEPL